jgi:hypothetical protein
MLRKNRQIITILLAAVVATAAVAQPMGHDFEGPYQEEALELFAEYWDRQPAELTFQEIDDMTSALSVPAQKNAYVRRSASASFFMPGFGQFMNNEPLLGTAFLLGDLAISVGATVGYYVLLPPQLKSDQLDYFNTPFSDIKAAWSAAFADASLADALPYLGIASGAMLLNGILGAVSASNARELAISRIESGEVTFIPRAGIITDSLGNLGVGLSWHY